MYAIRSYYEFTFDPYFHRTCLIEGEGGGDTCLGVAILALRDHGLHFAHFFLSGCLIVFLQDSYNFV